MTKTGVGGIQGYILGNQLGLTGWDLFATTMAGAGVGTLTAGVGTSIAASGAPLANTLGIVFGSALNSAGTAIYTGGRTETTIGFGVASYNFTQHEFGYLGKEGNSKLENIGYSFGALANIQDLFALNMGADIDYNSLKDPVGHGSITNDSRTIDISKGHDSGNMFWGGKGKKWGTAPKEDLFPRLKIRNVNKPLMEWMTRNISRGKGIWGKSQLTYGLLGNTCTSQCARALWTAGVWGTNPFTISPHMLYLQLAVRQFGIENSQYLYQTNLK